MTTKNNLVTKSAGHLLKDTRGDAFLFRDAYRTIVPPVARVVIVCVLVWSSVWAAHLFFPASVKTVIKCVLHTDR